jgi:hypothetical protein
MLARGVANSVDGLKFIPGSGATALGSVMHAS